ncbi:MAG: hypothetical protein ACRDGA_01605 [Bacteroidota bacterium]
MGRTALFLVMGLGMGMSAISFNISNTTERALENNYSYYKYMYARNLARTAIHAALRGFDRNTDPDTTKRVSFASGYFGITSARYSATPRDTIRMTAQGWFADTSYLIYTTLYRSTKPFPSINSAIGIRATPVTFNISGNPQIDGSNYDLTGTNLIGSGDVAGVATMNAVDSLSASLALGSNVLGSPPISVDTSTIDPLPFLEEYKLNADYVFNTPGTYASSQTWGSAGNPVIVYCNAGDDPTFSIKFSGGVIGYGILIIRGNLEFNGSFKFFGLVIVDGMNTQVKLGGGGTPQITGGIVVAGNAGAVIGLNGSGSSAKVRYSSQALANAKNIGKLRYYTIIDWYE